MDADSEVGSVPVLKTGGSVKGVGIVPSGIRQQKERK
jgi:hypothetical protein